MGTLRFGPSFRPGQAGHVVRRIAWTGLVLAALLSGCDGRPDIALTTALPINLPTARNEVVLYAMCANSVRSDPGVHIKIIYYHHPDGRRVFTVVPFCSDILKKYAKFQETPVPERKSAEERHLERWLFRPNAYSGKRARRSC